MIETHNEVKALREEVAEMKATLDQILTFVGDIKEQVQPMIDSLSKSPIMKMLGVK